MAGRNSHRNRESILPAKRKRLKGLSLSLRHGCQLVGTCRAPGRLQEPVWAGSKTQVQAYAAFTRGLGRTERLAC